MTKEFSIWTLGVLADNLKSKTCPPDKLRALSFAE